MVWYYAEGNQQRGPLSDAEFEEMIVNGRIRRETLVWRDGMENWQSLAVVRPATPETTAGVPTPPPPANTGTPAYGTGTPAASPQASSPASATPPAGTTAASGAAQTYVAPAADTTCSNCSRRVPVTDVTRYGAIQVCSTCRPAFLQQVRQAEGLAPGAPAAAPYPTTGYTAAPAQAVVYGGFWVRAIARSIDHFFITILQMIFLSPLLQPMQSLLEGVTTMDQIIKISPQLEEVSRRVLPYMLLISVLYHAVFVAAFSATPGKMFLGLRVIGKEGIRVNAARALTRAVVPALFLIFDRIIPAGIGTLALLIGYLMVAFDGEKRSLFDRIASTRVIKRR